MPFYEYQCSSCKYYVEVMQKISDAPLRKCPSCGKNALTKLVSAPVFRLKGSGWYETDFKSAEEKKRNLAGADQDAGAGEAKDAKETKSEDAKPAEKPAAKEAVSAKPAEKPAKASKSAARSSGRSAPPARKAAARAKPAAARARRKAR